MDCCEGDNREESNATDDATTTTLTEASNAPKLEVKG